MIAAEKASILLVDDRRENLLALQTILRDLGQDLVSASSGREALRACLERDFAVILLDVQMPKMDGFETAALIRERERSRGTPIIFLTAVGRGDEDIRRGYSLGAVDYILKPFVPEVLRWKVAVFVDLYLKTAELRRRQQEIEQLNAYLAASNQELEAFAYSVAHDLRSPLSGMHGLAVALLEDCGDALGEQGREYASEIVACAARLDAIIGDLLAYSRLALAEINLQPIDLRSVIQQALALQREAIEASGATVDVEDPLPDVLGHEAVLVQVLGNLLGNAIKFVRPGVRPSVRIEARPRDGWVRVDVVDNGIGIAQRDQERIFNMFERLHGVESYPGTGIGLAIVRKGVDRLGGRVGLTSRPGKGSRFWFELPAGQGGVT